MARHHEHAPAPRRLRTALLCATVALAIGACGSNPAYFRGDVMSVKDSTRVAVLPLVNLTKDVNAADIASNAVIVELMATHRFTVVDPGIVEDEVQRERLRLTDRLPLPALQAVGAALGVDYVFVGTVNEYTMLRETQVDIPEVSISLRMVSCSTGSIAWASTHSKRGDDSEVLFTLGRVQTLEQLASLTAREMMQTFMSDQGSSKHHQKKGTS